MGGKQVEQRLKNEADEGKDYGERWVQKPTNLVRIETVKARAYGLI